MFTKVLVLVADHKDVGNQAHDVSQLLQLSFFTLILEPTVVLFLYYFFRAYRQT
jgi:hypothetical protein